MMLFFYASTKNKFNSQALFNHALRICDTINIREAMKTDYHAKYFSYDLTKRCSSDTIEKFVQTLSEAQELFLIKWRIV